MNSTRTVQVTPELISEALEYYWRSIAMIKDHEEVKVILPPTDDFKYDFNVELVTTKEVVEVFRI